MALWVRTAKSFRLQQGTLCFLVRNNSSRKGFHPASRGMYFQEAFKLDNPYRKDDLLRAYLQRVLPRDILLTIQADLERFGDRVVNEIDDLGRQCELNPPKLRTYSPWGVRVDELITCHQWKQMHSISAEEGLVSVSYKKDMFAEYARLYGASKLMLFAPSSGLYSCPLAMTDGAAYLIESLNLQHSKLLEARQHMVSRDPKEFWTSGQWMTERGGGSDVAQGTDTYAVKESEGEYFSLSGYKWFSSATDANVAFTLARIVSEDGEVTPGTSGLSLFFLNVKDSNGCLNGIEIHKLKDKLGTRQLPTAELLLSGTKALCVSSPGRGVASISPMLTITRIHNAISSVALMRRMVQLAADYSTRRSAFGSPISQYPLHLHTLARLEVEARGCLLLLLDTCRILGRLESGQAGEDEGHLLRILTPLLKLYTGKQTVPFLSEGLESFGGQGYIEETGLPGMLRDGQVLPIWEGTTNVLSLDVLRSIQKSQNQSLNVLLNEIRKRLASVTNPALQSCMDATTGKVNFLVKTCTDILAGGSDGMQMAARDFSISLAHLYTSMLLLEHADSDVSTSADVVAARRWCNRSLPLLDASYYSSATSSSDKELLKI